MAKLVLVLIYARFQHHLTAASNLCNKQV